jgi:hypothetical protein
VGDDLQRAFGRACEAQEDGRWDSAG